MLCSFVHWVETKWQSQWTKWQSPNRNPEGVSSASCSERSGSAALQVGISETAISENASRNPLPANRPTATELAATNSLEHSHTTRTTPVQQVSRRLPDLGSMTPRTPRMWGTNHHTFPLRAGICSLAVAGVNFQFKFSDVQICMSGLS